MKVLCKIRAFFNGRIIKPGEFLNMDKCPTWGRVIDDKDTVYTSDKIPVENVDLLGTKKDSGQVQDNNLANEIIENPDKFADKTPEELEQKLDALLTKGLDLGIMIDGLEKLTIKEQIEKLETEINKKSEEV